MRYSVIICPARLLAPGCSGEEGHSCRDATPHPSHILPKPGVGSPVPRASSSQLVMAAEFRETAERLLLLRAPENILFPWNKREKKMWVESSPLGLEVGNVWPSQEPAFPAASWRWLITCWKGCLELGIFHG